MADRAKATSEDRRSILYVGAFYEVVVQRKSKDSEQANTSRRKEEIHGEKAPVLLFCRLVYAKSMPKHAEHCLFQLSYLFRMSYQRKREIGSSSHLWRIS